MDFLKIPINVTDRKQLYHCNSSFKVKKTHFVYYLVEVNLFLLHFGEQTITRRCKRAAVNLALR